MKNHLDFILRVSPLYQIILNSYIPSRNLRSIKNPAKRINLNIFSNPTVSLSIPRAILVQLLSMEVALKHTDLIKIHCLFLALKLKTVITKSIKSMIAVREY